MDVLQIVFFAAIAVVLGVFLFRVLGRPTGYMGEDETHEDPDYRGPYGHNEDLDKNKETSIIRPEVFQRYDREVADGLKSIEAEDRAFEPVNFVEGAKGAYRMIVEAFAEGNREALKPLLSERVFNAYSQAIGDRESRGETMKTQVERFADVKITHASLNKGRARVKVYFASDLATETKNAAGERIAGDWSTLQSVKETWSFERDVASDNPNWVLAGVKPEDDA
ncbi:Tim44/TimA family putative adaptor protein [Woodsholea maritima]|uniref:Tim44/TimA family putative adaptor protein n=1 Tax=Woodsholea maritima TaxID=240237 RepID=UPI00037849D5|nr:Tim44/TimA family putative adaptor protein [Woodsholea maritima]